MLGRLLRPLGWHRPHRATRSLAVNLMAWPVLRREQRRRAPWSKPNSRALAFGVPLGSIRSSGTGERWTRTAASEPARLQSCIMTVVNDCSPSSPDTHGNGALAHVV